MKTDNINIALSRLREYISSSKRRNTPEREEVLRAAYAIESRFTFEDIDDYIRNNSDLIISHTTIYSALRLFVEQDFLRCTRLNSRSYYDISLTKNSCLQVCRICGKTTYLDSKKIEKMVDAIKLKRFTRDNFTLTIDGICTSCKTKLTKAANKKIKTKPNIRK